MSDAEKIVRDFLEKTLHKLEYSELEIKQFSSDASNFSTILFEVTFSSPGKENLYVFVKAGAVGGQFREQMNVSILYDTEYQFYTELLPAFNELYNKYEVPDEDRVVVPKFYAGTLDSEAEVLVLENLKKNKFSLFDRKKPVDWEHAAVSIKDLARFHALGFALKKENPELFAKFDKQSHFQEIMEKSAPQMEAALAGFLKVVAEEYKPKIGAVLADKEFMLKSFGGSLGSGINTLIHADYRTSNIMYKRRRGKLVSIPVDFQTLRVGNVVFDILYFIVLGTDETFRKHHWNQLLDYYYTELTSSLRYFKLDITDIYPREVFDEDLKTFLPAHLTTILMVLPLVLVDTEVAPDMSAQDATFENFTIAPNELILTRVNGIIRDLAKMGAF